MFRKSVIEKDFQEIASSPHSRMVLARAVRSLSGVEKTVLSVIVEACNPEYGGACWLAQGNIAEELGAARSTVSRAYSKFLERGLISYKPGDMASMAHTEPPYRANTVLVYLNLNALIEQSAPDWCEIPAAPAVLTDPGADNGADDTVCSGEVIDPAPQPPAAPAGLGATQPALAAPPLAHLRPTPAGEEQAGSIQPAPSAPAAHLALAGPTSTASATQESPTRSKWASQSEEENRKQQMAQLLEMMDAEQSA